jgi:hypothetical protein
MARLLQLPQRAMILARNSEGRHGGALLTEVGVTWTRHRFRSVFYLCQAIRKPLPRRSPYWYLAQAFGENFSIA